MTLSQRRAPHAAAPIVAERLAKVAVGSDTVSSTDLQAMSSVLDLASSEGLPTSK
jgi:hypothetical protein